MRKILVVGSTSNAGRALVRELADAGESVRAATRNPEAFEASEAVEPVRFDYDDPGSFEAALEGVSGVFAIGPPVPNPDAAMIPFLELATAGSQRKIVLMTAMGTEYDEAGSLRRVELTVERSGSPYVILRPNWFMDNFHTSWLEPIRDAGVIPLPAGEARTSLIDARDIAACAAAALRSDRYDGNAYTLTGPEALTYGEAAAILSQAAGREIRYVPIDDEAFVGALVEAGEAEDLARYLAVLFSFVREGAAAEVSPAVEQLTGRPPRSFAQYARDRAAAWRA